MTDRYRNIQSYVARRAVFEALGGRCECIDESVCAGDRWDCLQVDHRIGDGYLEGKGRGGLDTVYRTLRRIGHNAFRASRQLLCLNCHILKGIMEGDHLHKGGNGVLELPLNQVEMF